MCNRKHNGVHIFNVLNIGEFNAVKSFRLVGIGGRVGNYRLNAVFAQFLYNIEYLAVAGIGAIFLKGKAKYGNLSVFNRLFGFDKGFNNVFGNLFAHIVVNAATRKNNLTVIAHHFGFICKLIRVNAYAMPDYKTGVEF